MNRHWNFIPGKGIKKGETKISLGEPQQSVRDAMTAEFGAPVSHRDDEDDFENPSGDTLIRLRYDAGNVKDIEFLRGSLYLDDLCLLGDCEWPEIEHKLRALGHTHRDTEWLGDGYDILTLGINIATHEQVGGDGDGIEWVILSQDFLHV